MNHYDARQITDGPHAGKWHYTSGNRRTGTHPVGYCSPWRNCPNGCPVKSLDRRENPDCEECGDTGAVKGEQHYHDTEQEARECIRRYVLDNVHPVEMGWTDCQVEGCENPARKGFHLGHPRKSIVALCEEHCTTEQLESMVEPLGQMWASW